MTPGVRTVAAEAADGIDDTYAFFLGRWRVHRAIQDHRHSRSGIFSGTATVAPSTPVQGDLSTAEYREVGGLHLGAYRGAAHRRLRFLGQEDGTVVIAFADGRTLARCNLRSGRCEATHRCGDDRYDISWRVRSRRAVTEEWRVRGPEKDYVASAMLWRLPGSERIDGLPIGSLAPVLGSPDPSDAVSVLHPPLSR